MPSVCPVCGKEGEMMDHIFFPYPWVALVWRLTSFHNIFVQLVDYVDTFITLIRPPSAHPSTTPLAYIAYHIWLTQNAFVFDSSRPSIKAILERARAHA